MNLYLVSRVFIAAYEIGILPILQIAKLREILSKVYLSKLSRLFYPLY